jgi:hypothetical protein
MMQAIRRQDRAAAATVLKARPHLLGTRRMLQVAAWLAILAILLPAAGCGGGSDKKAKDSATVTQNEAPQYY